MAFWSRLFGFGMLDKVVQHPEYRSAKREPEPRSKPPRIAAQLILCVLGLSGFSDAPWLFLTAGGLLLLMDVFAMLVTRILNPLFPIALYIGGWVFIGDWRGILVGAIAGNLFDAGMTGLRRIVRRLSSRG